MPSSSSLRPRHASASLPSIDPSTNSPNVLTYRLNGKDDTMVYVTPGEDFDQALDYAYSVYPEELKDVARDRVQFYVNVKDSRSSRIAPMAWKVVVASLTRFEILDITIRKDEPPPQYTQPSSDEKADGYLHPAFNPRSTPSPTPSKRALARGWIDKLLD